MISMFDAAKFVESREQETDANGVVDAADGCQWCCRCSGGGGS
jgi:hypothetical protein